MKDLKRPISYEFNEKNGARLADFNGWAMPTFYSSITEEHGACRNNIGLFDVSHMGRWWVTGKDSQKFLNHLITNDLGPLKEGRSLYTAMLNEEGGIIDDLIIYKITEGEKFMVVTNAGNHEIDTNWFKQHTAKFDVDLFDNTNTWGQVAIQGPKAKAATEKLLGLEKGLKYFSFKEVYYKDFQMLIAATGYTGEKGYELYGPPEQLMEIWQRLIDEADAKPCGLGSRDILRLEAGYCLHGNDIDPKTSPYEAGLDWVTKMDKEDFIGKANANRKDKKLVGIAFPEGQKIIPRAHTKVMDANGNEIGEVTSGNYSQMLNRSIAMAYIKADQNLDTVKIEIRGKEAIGQVGEPWFYRNIRKAEYSPVILSVAKDPVKI